MSYEVHNFQGLAVANQPSKPSKNLNATKI